MSESVDPVPTTLSPRLVERMARLHGEFADLELRLADPGVLADPDELRRVSTRYRELQPIAEALDRQRALNADLRAARELLADATDDEHDLLEAEVAQATVALAAVDDELRAALV